MANVKISELPLASIPLDGTEEVPIVKDGQTVKTTTESIRGGYKVYTALLTQSGGDNVLEIVQGGTLSVGVTYYIFINDDNVDLTTFGAPNSNVGTYFVCTQAGGLPGGVNISLQYNTGAPITTILDNTLGDIWFVFNGDGEYAVFSDDLFTLNKTFITIGSAAEGAVNGIFTSATPGTTSYMYIQSAVTSTITPVNDDLYNTSFEIRVYN